MKKIIKSCAVVSAVLLALFCLASCSDEKVQTDADTTVESENTASVFTATVNDVRDNRIISVTPDEGTWERSSSDLIDFRVPDECEMPEIGDRVEISHSGEILESYPASLSAVYDVKPAE